MSDLSMISQEREGNRWRVTIERGNAEVVWSLRLTDMERKQLGSLLCSDLDSVRFLDLDLPKIRLGDSDE